MSTFPRYPLTVLALPLFLGAAFGANEFSRVPSFDGSGAVQFFAANADASVVVGRARTAAGVEGVFWTPAGGLQRVPALPGVDPNAFEGAFESSATVVDRAGNLISGSTLKADGSVVTFIHDRRDGSVVIAEDTVGAGVWARVFVTAFAVDGTVIVGQVANQQSTVEQAFIKRGSAPLELIPLLPGYGAISTYQVTPDGVWVGLDAYKASPGSAQTRRSVVWSAATGLVPLPSPGPYADFSGISAEGAIKVGAAHPSASATVAEPVYWDAANQLHVIPSPDPAYTLGRGWNVTDDGRLITGYRRDVSTGTVPGGYRQEAFLFTQWGGARWFGDALGGLLGSAVLAQIQEFPEAFPSPDGSAVFGYLTDERGVYEGFVFRNASSLGAPIALFSSAVARGQGWFDWPSFRLAWAPLAAFPLAYVEGLGWLAAGEVASGGLWFWDPRSGLWLWTSDQLFPSFYDPVGNRLIRFL